MLNKLIAATVFLLAAGWAAPSEAQTVNGDRFRLNSGACVIRSQAGVSNPEGIVAGNAPCDEFHADDGRVYKKISGSATNTGWYPVLGATSATCTTFAGCVAAQMTIDTTNFIQALRTDPTKRLRTFVNTDGGRIESYTDVGWAPLKLTGAPVQVMGGGFVLGNSTLIDPGVGNGQIDGFIGKPGYVSQTTGWRIDGLGAADFRYLYTDELHAKKFIADLEQALAGLQIIAKSVGQVGEAFTVPSAGNAATLVMKDLPSAEDMAIFESGDYVWLRTFSRAGGSLTIGNAYGIVTSYADLPDKMQSWTFTRLATNEGSITGGTVIEVDSIVLDAGVPGNGWIETNAVDGLYGINAPYTQIVTWTGNSPISGNQTLRVRMGHLRGITAVTNEYGIIAGTYAATGGQYFRASNQAFELHGINLLMWDGATNVIKLDRTAPSFALGSSVPTAYGTGTGVWMGKDGGAYKFRVGVPGGAGVFWDGTTLNVSGSVTVTGGNAAKVDLSNVTGNYAGSASVGGSANDTAAVNGVAAATVSQGAQRANTALNSSGTLVTKAVPTSAVSPSGAGLYLGADFLGYYNGSAWRTYMDNAGNFYLGGTSGALQWNGSTLAVTGTVTATDGSFGGWTISAIRFYSADGYISMWPGASNVAHMQIGSGAGAATSGINAGEVGSDISFWSGSTHANRASAPFRVNLNGDLVATSATISGAITAATITGSTIVGGPGGSLGSLTIDSTGVTFTDGTNYGNAVNWDDGSYVRSASGEMMVQAGSGLSLKSSSTAGIYIAGSAVGPYSASTDLGTSSQQWRDLYLTKDIFMFNPTTTTGSHYPIVWDSGSQFTRRKTDGVDATVCGSGDVVETVTFELGIAVGYTCAPNPSPQVATLRQEIAELRAMILALSINKGVQ